MDEQNRNLLLATALSFLVILVWFTLFPPPEPQVQPDSVEQTQAYSASVPVPAASTGTSEPSSAEKSDSIALADAPRVKIESELLRGSVSLLGGRIDELQFNDFRVSLEPEAPNVTFFSPEGTPGANYALFGWAPGAGVDPKSVPTPNTLWTLSEGSTLTPETPITLSWNNGLGQVFKRRISVDDRYMFSVEQTVMNSSTNSVAMAPYGMIAQHGLPEDVRNFFVLHEGAVSMSAGELTETGWEDISDADVNAKWARPAIVAEDTTDGWLGFTEHYWQSMLIPAKDQLFDQALTYEPKTEVYRAFARMPTQTIAAGQTATITTSLFAGPKEWQVLSAYQTEGVSKFVDSIDWGWFFLLTKPIFWLLHELNLLIGNMGIAIITLTLLIKAVLFPLAYKSYVSMAKMKELQPQMEALKERAGDDRQKLQQGMMELYKKEKVNPAAGCLPILLQIPIFFSLYKVIYVTIELRQAPFFGPFKDLAAPDPTSIANLWGWLPWGTPEPGSLLALILIGILPLLLGISMWLQQKLNPAPTDPTQQMIFAWMPWMFMFMLGSFPSGLVVYWIANNTITFTQQYLIMRSQGYTPDLLGNIKSSFKKNKASSGDEGKK